jgi:hypothetical protein
MTRRGSTGVRHAGSSFVRMTGGPICGSGDSLGRQREDLQGSGTPGTSFL